MPTKTDLCKVLETITLSPGPATAMTAAWLVPVEPFTPKRQRSAPQSFAASASASRIKDGLIRFGWLPGNTGISPSTTGPVRSVRPLWPGIWKGYRSEVMSLIHASSNGAELRSPIGSFGSSSVAAPKACSDNHSHFRITIKAKRLRQLSFFSHQVLVNF